jgi:hypothetical protein
MNCHSFLFFPKIKYSVPLEEKFDCFEFLYWESGRFWPLAKHGNKQAKQATSSNKTAFSRFFLCLGVCNKQKGIDLSSAASPQSISIINTIACPILLAKIVGV